MSADPAAQDPSGKEQEWVMSTAVYRYDMSSGHCSTQGTAKCDMEGQLLPESRCGEAHAS
jgi:hypothetical protein